VKQALRTCQKNSVCCERALWTVERALYISYMYAYTRLEFWQPAQCSALWSAPPRPWRCAMASAYMQRALRLRDKTRMYPREVPYVQIKRPYVFVKRAVCIMKRAVGITKKAECTVEKSPMCCKKGPMYLWKEPYILWKEPYVYRTRICTACSVLSSTKV